MPQFRSLILAASFGLSFSPACGESVLWKATGSIASGTGAFDSVDLAPGTEAQIRITYDDQALQVIKTNVLGRIESDYQNDIALRVIITVGSSVWEGFVQSGTSSSPTTFFTKTSAFSNQESAELDIFSTDNGSFPTFPLKNEEGTSSISLTFGSNSNQFLASGISKNDIRADLLSSATAEITTGPNNDQLAITIDPGSFEVLNEADEITAPIAPLITAETNSDNITLSWFADLRFRYRIESSPDLSSDSWSEIETRNGTQTFISRSYPRSSERLFYRVVAINRDL